MEPPHPRTAASAPDSAVRRINPQPRQASLAEPHLDLTRWHVSGGPGTRNALRALRAELPEPAGTRSERTGTAIRIDVDPAAGLAPEGYAITTQPAGPHPEVRLVGADPSGAFYAARTLLELAAAPCAEHPACLPRAAVRDWPELPLRGTIEGFYGPPWSHADRMAHLRFSGRHKLNHYVYAPKDDRLHRERWREPYPDDELALLGELAAEAAANHVRFVFALSPGLSMVYSDPAEQEVLHAKAAQVRDVGVRDFALLFDDIPLKLVHERDLAVFGDGPGSSGAAHAAVCRAFESDFLGADAPAHPLLMVPTDYAGTDASPYRDRLAAGLSDQTLVWWTGADIVVGAVTADHITAAAASFGDRIALWDNFPVNDFDPARVFLGPLTGRSTRTGLSGFTGITANPMVESAASQLALATTADYAWNPAGYAAERAHERAIGLVPGAAELRPLVEACSAWPPDADQSPRLSALCAGALRGDADDTAALRAELTRLADLPVAARHRFAEQLRPWAEAGRDMGAAGIEALDLLRAAAGGSATVRDAAERTRAALDRSERHRANVLREVIPPFVRAALDLTAAPAV